MEQLRIGIRHSTQVQGPLRTLRRGERRGENRERGEVWEEGFQNTRMKENERVRRVFIDIKARTGAVAVWT